MEITTALFYAFSAVLLGSAVRVITARSTVHSALFLILAFFSAACVWMLLKAEFLAITLILVYIGAVMVLFLFVVMMLDMEKATATREGFFKHLPLAGLVGALIALEMAAVLMQGFRLSDAPELSAEAAKLGNTKLLGIVVYTQYLYPLEVAAVLLLVAVVAAIALTLRSRKDARGQNPGQQVRVKKADRLKIVKMAPTLPEVPAPAAEENSKGAA
jgi:NADH-quinone oxidoreductase subunit J